MMTAETGECIVTRHNGPDGDFLTIDRADPRVWISAELLDEIANLTARDEDRFSSLVGDVLTIHGRDRTVVYRVKFDTYDATQDRYLMEWPD